MIEDIIGTLIILIALGSVFLPVIIGGIFFMVVIVYKVVDLTFDIITGSTEIQTSISKSTTHAAPSSKSSTSSDSEPEIIYGDDGMDLIEKAEEEARIAGRYEYDVDDDDDGGDGGILGKIWPWD